MGDSNRGLADFLGERMNKKLAAALGHRLDGWLAQSKRLAENVHLDSVVDDMRTFAKRPRALSSWIESKSPWLNRQFLTAASNLIEPFLVGMGLRVERIGEESVEVSMPDIWRNQGEGGSIHTGAIVSLGEFTTRLYWEYHLDVRRSEMRTEAVRMRAIAKSNGSLRAVFRMPVSEREVIQHRLRAESRVTIETLASIYDGGGRLVAEVEVDWELSRPLALNAGASEAPQTSDENT